MMMSEVVRVVLLMLAVILVVMEQIDAKGKSKLAWAMLIVMAVFYFGRV